jgi:glycosyltransferase involved in cell wall biosynthesis
MNNNQSKNILITMPTDEFGGGAEQYLEMVAKKFLADGYKIHIFFEKRKTTDRWDSMGKLYYTNTQEEKYGIPFLLINLLKNRNIHFNYAFSSYVVFSSLLGFLRKIRILKIKYLIARESTSIFKRFTGLKLFQFKIFYHLGYPAVDLLVCQTGYMKKQLLENLPWMEKKVNVQVIPNPVNVNSMFEKAKEELDMPAGGSFIIAAGRFISEKGFDILIAAFSKLKQKYLDLKLVILGDGKLRSEIEILIKELKQENEVILYGFVDNVYPFFKQARMCVISSRIEGFPNVLLQMMSQNEKIVSTLCAGDIDKIDGLFTCKPNNEQDLLRAMQQCLEADTARSRTLFDKELQDRSIDGFMDKVSSYLE